MSTREAIIFAAVLRLSAAAVNTAVITMLPRFDTPSLIFYAPLSHYYAQRYACHNADDARCHYARLLPPERRHA